MLNERISFSLFQKFALKVCKIVRGGCKTQKVIIMKSLFSKKYDMTTQCYKITILTAKQYFLILLITYKHCCILY